MPRTRSNTRPASSLRESIERCLDVARRQRNLSVDRVADQMGLASRWTLYKWLENGRMPAILIRPFEQACGAIHLTEYLALSAGRLLIAQPTGRRAKEVELAELHEAFARALGKLARVYQGEDGPGEAIEELSALVGYLAWHVENLRRYEAPELELEVMR